MEARIMKEFGLTEMVIKDVEEIKNPTKEDKTAMKNVTLGEPSINFA